MMILQEHVLQVNPVERNRQLAIDQIQDYLQRPEERVLRDYQIDVMQSLKDFFAEGETAGYINLPTGSGKSHLIAEIAQALSMRTLVLSPQVNILKQTGGKFNPDMNVTSYHKDSKDTSGMVVNTTYQSLGSLIKKGRIDPSDFDLIIADEAHTGLGEERHKIYKPFSNALFVGLTATPYFSPIERYKRRDLVRADERWTGMFEKSIHDMSLEEAIERDILTNLDVHILKTGVRVSDIKIDGLGKYSNADLERYLNVKARNNITLAILLGLDNLPKDIEIPDNLREEIARIHEQIKGKKTAIFGISIEHIEELGKLLSESGQRVSVVHSKIDSNERGEIFKEYEKADSGIILGVDMLRLGWDSPSTEVGIYLAPTRSGIVATQETGRILRPNEGKEKAIAVQFADLFDKSSQAPVLIPNIFDPYFILRGTQTGNKVNHGQNGEGGDLNKPKITFSGVGIEAIVENARSQEILRQRITKASLEELDEVTSRIALDVYNKNPEASPLEMYRSLAAEFPLRVSNDVLEKVLQSISSIDSNTVRMGKRILVSLYMKTLLSVAENYFTKDLDADSEIMHAAIGYVYENVGKIANSKAAMVSFNKLVRDGVLKHVAEKENVPVKWVREKKLAEIKTRALAITSNKSVEDLDYYAKLLAEAVGEQVGEIRNYLEYLMDLKRDNNVTTEPSDTEDRVFPISLEVEVERALDLLQSRQRQVIQMRFGLNDSSAMTLEEAGNNLGVTRERIRHIEAKALRRLRRPSISIKLKDYKETLTYRPLRNETSAGQRSEDFNRGQEALAGRVGMVLNPEKYQSRESRIASLHSKSLEQRTWHFVNKTRRDGGTTVVGVRTDILSNPEELAGLKRALEDYGGFERITVGYSHGKIEVLLSMLEGINYIRYSVLPSNNKSEVLFEAKHAMNQFSIPFVIAPLEIAIELLPREIKSQILS